MGKGINVSDIEFRSWVIYDNPRDHPGKAIVRQWVVLKSTGQPEATNDLMVFDSVKDAKRDHPRASSRVFMERHPNDDPVIAGYFV